MNPKVHWVPVAALILMLLLAACGRGDEEGGDGGSDGGEAASQAPEIDTSAASGEIDVWAMGAEGEALGALA